MTDTPEIIIIDDNLLDVELILVALKNKKISNDALIFKDGEESLDYLFCKKKYENRNFKNLPRVIMLNNMLQKNNSIEILKKIKMNDQTNSIPIVMLSSSSDKKEIIECYKAGANSFIIKPVEYNEFSETICKIAQYWLHFNKSPL
jgi:two-component system response regulator